MNNVKFLKEPGYMYDLFFLFTLYFNKDYCLTHYVNKGSTDEDVAEYKKILVELDSIPEDLYPFFYLKDKDTSFMTLVYYIQYSNIITSGYNLKFVQRELSNYDKVTENLIKYYFPDVTDSVLDECKHSVNAIGRIIKESDYNNDIKCGLYSFFIDPATAIQRLSYELMEKSFWLSQKYEKYYSLNESLMNNFDIEDTVNKMNVTLNQKLDFSVYNNICVSFCFLNFNTLHCLLHNTGIFFVLGSKYNETLNYLVSVDDNPNLDLFGNALSVRDRIDMLDYIDRVGETGIKEIEHEFNMSGTTAYYHLSMLIKGGMLKTRNSGRIVLYSVNREYFGVVCNRLSKYIHAKENDNENMEKTNN